MYIYIVENVLTHPQVEHLNCVIVIAEDDEDCLDAIIYHNDYFIGLAYDLFDEKEDHIEKSKKVSRLTNLIKESKKIKIDDSENLEPGIIKSICC